MRILKGQISIEFMIIFSFILVVFLFLFALISQQRAQTQNSQTFSQLQLVAQSLALQISRASQAGSGYSALIPITTNIGNIPYNLSVTKSGVVIVSTKVGTQQITTTAYSNVQSVLSSSIFYGATNSVYVLPITNGSIYLQNSFGVICIDYQCPSGTNQSAILSVYSQNVHSAYFDGSLAGTSALTGSDTNTLQSNQGQGFSFSAWVYPTETSTSRGITQGDSYVFRIDSPGEGGKLSWFVYIGGAIEPRLSSTAALKLNRWYHVVGTYNSSTGYMGLYINGALNKSQTRAGSPSLGYCSCFNIGVGSSSDWYGNIANAQLYDVGLSANQVRALYINGIASAPINSTYLRGWWTLNGNSNDYSGYGDNLVSSGVIFPAVSELFAKATNAAGKPLNNLLVGFATTLGNLTNGYTTGGQSIANYTNANGVASVFLNQQGNNGQALVRVTPMYSNTPLQSSLVGWYPMNLNQGNIVYDLSGGKNNAAFVSQPSWTSPNYGANFSSPTAAVQTPLVYPYLGTNAVTVTAWIYPRGPTSSSATFLISSDFLLTITGGKLWAYTHVGNGGGGTLNSNSWNFVSATVSSPVNPTVNLYLNGVLVSSTTYSGNVGSGCGAALAYSFGSSGSCSGAGLNFNGTMANVQIYNSSLTQSSIMQLYNQGIGGAPLAGMSLAGYWPLNGNANDYSSGKNATINGQISFSPLAPSIPPILISSNGIGRSLVANFIGPGAGPGAYTIPIPSSNALNPTNSLSISAWIYPSISQTKIVAVKNNVISGAGFDYEIGQSNQNIFFGLAKGGSANVLYSNSIIGLNAWHYVAGTWNGSAMKIYIDGILDSNSMSLSSPIDSSQNALTIGGYYNGNSPYNGLVTNVQVYSSALSQLQIQAAYWQGIGGTPPLLAKPIGYWPLNGNANDFSATGANGTSSNVVFKNVLSYVPYLLASYNYSGVSLNGQNAYMTAGINNFPTGSSARSLFAWVNLNKLGPNPTIDFYGTEASTQAAALSFSSNALTFVGWSDDFTSSLTTQTNGWHFVGYTYSAGSNKVTLYLDGRSQTGTLSSSSALNTVLSANHDIGARYDCVSNGCTELNGSIANLQIFNTNLTSSQVMQLYNSGIPPSSSITIPLSWLP